MTSWAALTEEQRDAVRTLLDDAVNSLGGWGLPNDIEERGMTEAEWIEALDTAREMLT